MFIRNGLFNFAAASLKLIHFPGKIDWQRETKRERVAAAFHPIKYATIISVRGQARSMMLRVLFRVAKMVNFL